jgi:cytochrome c553
MKSGSTKNRIFVRAGSGMLLVLGFAVFASFGADAFGSWRSWHKHRSDTCDQCDSPPMREPGGTWYWLRSPDEERRVVAGLYNRYCIRCHGVDGRGVWDIPGVPDLTNGGWQASRTDAQLARRIVEGRGAVMPPFRGTLSLDEAWAMSRYLRTFVPGTEISPPDFTPPKKLEKPSK